MTRHLAGFATAILIIASAASDASAQPVQLSLEDTLERARTSAPAAVAARMNLDEARELLSGASRRFEENPAIELRRARRDSGSGSSWDQEVTLHHPLDLRGERGARIDSAEAALLEQQARVDAFIRSLQYDAATAHAAAVAASDGITLAQAALELAEATATMMDRRFEAGDVAQLDLNLARAQQARARAALLAATASRNEALASLAALLGYDPLQITVTGSLAPVEIENRADLKTQLSNLPEIRILDATIASAEADLRRARAYRWPELGLAGSWAEEEGDEIIGAAVELTLPVYDRGQILNALANARLGRLRAERAALLRSWETRLSGEIEKYQSLVSAAEQAGIAAELATENEQLAIESYEGGQIGLAELILVQRESNETRTEWLDRMLAARRAAIAIDHIGGFSR